MSQSIAELFIKEAIKTENLDLSKLMERLSEEKTLRLLHSAMGMVTEAGEFMDALKKHIIYGKPLDEINLKEELGDLNWYEAIAHNILNSSFEEVMVINIQKLRKRYANKFSESEALTRDLSSERNELEKKIDLASGFGMGSKKLTEAIKMEIEDEDYMNSEGGIKESPYFNSCPECMYADNYIHLTALKDNNTISEPICNPKKGFYKTSMSLAKIDCPNCIMIARVNYDKSK